MCRFVHSLEDDWPSLADHLGYPPQLVQAIQNHWCGSHISQIQAFLKYWVFPDCGMTNNLRIVERLKMCLEKGEIAFVCTCINCGIIKIVPFRDRYINTVYDVF